MRIIIVGAGEVGAYLAETLSRHDHDVTVLEQNESVASALDEQTDVRVVRSSGSSALALQRAGIADCDFFLALTSNDETNLVSSSIARALGARTTVARVHDGVYRDSTAINYQEHFGIDLLFNPERLAAVELAKHIRNPDRVAVEDFARGQVEVQLVEVSANAPVVGKTLAQLRLNPRMRVAVVRRGDESMVASANLKLHAGDLVTVCGPPEALFEVRPAFEPASSPARNLRVVIMGGSEMGVSLVRLLSSPRFRLRVIEPDRKRCEVLAERFPHISVIHGHGTSLRLLEEEHVGDADYFVACTRDDEENIMACLQARKLGTRKLFLAINRADYTEVVQTSRATLGIDIAVSPRLATATEIMRYISREKYIELATLPGGVGRVIELKIAAGSACDGKKMREVQWPAGSVVLALQHKGDARTPGPDDEMQAGDRIACLLQPDLLDDVVRLATRA